MVVLQLLLSIVYLFRPELILGFALIVSPVGAITYRLIDFPCFLTGWWNMAFRTHSLDPFMIMDLLSYEMYSAPQAAMPPR